MIVFHKFFFLNLNVGIVGCQPVSCDLFKVLRLLRGTRECVVCWKESSIQPTLQHKYTSSQYQTIAQLAQQYPKDYQYLFHSSKGPMGDFNNGIRPTRLYHNINTCYLFLSTVYIITRCWIFTNGLSLGDFNNTQCSVYGTHIYIYNFFSKLSHSV